MILKQRDLKIVDGETIFSVNNLLPPKDSKRSILVNLIEF
jgi:hypothetical protein